MDSLLNALAFDFASLSLFSRRRDHPEQIPLSQEDSHETERKRVRANQTCSGVYQRCHAG